MWNFAGCFKDWFFSPWWKWEPWETLIQCQGWILLSELCGVRWVNQAISLLLLLVSHVPAPPSVPPQATCGFLRSCGSVGEVGCCSIFASSETCLCLEWGTWSVTEMRQRRREKEQFSESEEPFGLRVWRGWQPISCSPHVNYNLTEWNVFISIFSPYDNYL